MGREVVVAVTKGRLDFGTWERIFYGEFDGRRSIGTWTPSELQVGQALRKPVPLFKKLDESIIEKYARLEA
jgi:hypothetical protein